MEIASQVNKRAADNEPMNESKVSGEIMNLRARTLTLEANKVHITSIDVCTVAHTH